VDPLQLQFRITEMTTAYVPALDTVLAAVTLAPLASPDVPVSQLAPGGDVLPRPFRVSGIPLERAGQYRVNDVVTITVELPPAPDEPAPDEPSPDEPPA